MFKLIVTKKGQTQQSDFATEQECLDHFEKYKARGFWGKEEYSVDHPIVEAVYATVIHPAEPALLDENNVEVIPAKEEWSGKVLAIAEIPAWTEIVPREYSYEIINNTAQVEAENTKKELKNTRRTQRVNSLKSVDWNNVKTITDCKDILKQIAEEILKDEA